MPRYLCEAPPTTAADRERACRLAARRFPEVDFEQRLAAHDDWGSVDREMWVCRAPSRTHLLGWAAAAGIDFASVQQVEVTTFSGGPRSGGQQGEGPWP